MIQETIQKLASMGRMPDASEDNLSSELIDEYAPLIHASVKPINREEASILITLFPEDELFGVEQSLLHLFESIYHTIPLDEYKSIIEKCPSDEWRETLLKRVRNAGVD
ncbi:MAG: hypothetical protein LUH10_16840 [Tannerellaceae bacterium]|nr:hypothetical protein [Tannerellaceae bacterium]